MDLCLHFFFLLTAELCSHSLFSLRVEQCLHSLYVGKFCSYIFVRYIFCSLFLLDIYLASKMEIQMTIELIGQFFAKNCFYITLHGATYLILFITFPQKAMIGF